MRQYCIYCIFSSYSCFSLHIYIRNRMTFLKAFTSLVLPLLILLSHHRPHYSSLLLNIEQGHLWLFLMYTPVMIHLLRFTVTIKSCSILSIRQAKIYLNVGFKCDIVMGLKQ